ncbi:MAG TPA: hypothetical protein VK582_02650 [Pyrinomonadaceae bacterium]|nr:hypothetical protein [Pyrinomonadaceae bacterium]
MNLKKLGIGLALALTLGLSVIMFGGQRTQAAGTWYVSTTGVPTGVSGGSCSNPSFNTIGAAVAAASNGDTIQVCAGTYPESFGVDKGLVINGPNAGISPNGGTRVAEAIINSTGNPTIRISTTAPVTIDGFSFTGATGANIDSYTSGNNPIIKRNIFTAGSDGFFFNEPALFTFEDNYLHDLTDCGGCDGVFIAGNWNGSTGTVASIKSNVWSTIGSSGMNLSNVSGSISGNHFSYVTYYCALLANGTNVDVKDNTFEHTINPDLTVRTWGAGVRFYAPSAGFGARITGNTFSNNYVGIGVRMGSPTANITGMDVYAHKNKFVGNTAAGLRHDGLGTFNATCNWWNSASGPTNAGNPGGTGDVVDGTGPVNFTPWLIAPGGDCIGGLIATNKDQCKNGGWQTLFRANGTTFKNQGDCIQYVNTGK